MKRKKELIVVLTSLLVIVLSVSVAYFTTKILGTGKDISVTSADLKVIFTSGSGTINGTNIEPGWTSGENTFTVKNESNGTYKYNIIIKDLVNTFTTSGFLVYKITSADGGYTMTDFADVPKSSTATDIILAENISIEKGATHTYKIIINYNNSEGVDQSADMGKTLTGKIFITKGTERPTLANQLLNDNPTIGTRTDFSTPFTTNTANTLYKATENGTDVYYFAGQDTESTPINNWVKFGKNSSNQDLYWRIIRTNSDGGVRLLYHGTSTTATNAYIGESEFNTYETSSPKYVGYMYGDTDATLEEARTNTNDSTIKTYIDNWYENNFTTYTNYLSNDAVYCNDRELASGASYSTTEEFYFKSYERLDGDNNGANASPTYDCANIKDAFSVNNQEAKLKYPIALMTADELAYAGGVAYTNAPMWYYTNSSLESSTGGILEWWSLSPHNWDGNGARSWSVYGSDVPGNLDSDDVGNLLGVRPAVSLKTCIKYSTGNGTSETPYEIVETSSGC